MLNAHSFASYLYLSVWEDYSKNTITVERSRSRFVTYTINSEKYLYQSSKNKKKELNAQYKSYKEEVTGNYYVHASSLGKLGYYKYFTGKDKVGKYADYGYSSIF